MENKRKKPKPKSKSFNMGLLALLVICVIYLILYPQFLPEEKSGLTSSFSTDSSSAEKAENAATVIQSDNKDETANAAQAAIEAIKEKSETKNKEYTFRSQNKLFEHYEKHGIDMGFVNENEYLEAANALINNPDALHKNEADDGDDIYYLEATDEIAFVSTDGYIRTYFICSGKDYYDRQ
ncbi:hypothetical protein [Butyrivibrio sp. AE3004]|uniref:hypothetical protein n=1 Tax=Butyrivibrio sp. AE3004 TaxID=1506994 RepID=UPI00068A825B|nr:hypothetical protein [Butyrivibrio sp. AE3004]